MFIHGGIAHIVGNMVFLYVFGDNVEDRFGHLRYLAVYFLWGMFATLVQSIYALSAGEGDTPSIGASGAISGIFGGYLIVFPRARIYTLVIAFFITTIRIPAIAFIPFWFILQILFTVIGESGGVAVGSSLESEQGMYGSSWYIRPCFLISTLAVFEKRDQEFEVRLLH